MDLGSAIQTISLIGLALIVWRIHRRHETHIHDMAEAGPDHTGLVLHPYRKNLVTGRDVYPPTTGVWPPPRPPTNANNVPKPSNT